MSERGIYGGQAVIEGVMMQGKHVNVTAVRRKSNQIEYLEVERTTKPWIQSLKKIPFIRGVVGIVESSAKGSVHLNFSADKYAEDELNDLSEEERAKELEKQKKNDGKISLGMILSVAAIGVLSFLFGKVIFTLIPAVLEDLIFKNFFESMFLHNIIEGAIKILFLLLYIYFLSLTPMIKKLFQYHGAEHKVISCYEAGEELTVENVQKYSRLHYRCGSSFIIFTVIIGVLLYSLPIFTWDTLWERVYIRLLLIPVVLGVSYEVLRLTNSVRSIPVLRYLGYPGLWLQLLTTKEPKNDQVEVSIASFTRMLELDQKIEFEKKNA